MESVSTNNPANDLKESVPQCSDDINSAKDAAKLLAFWRKKEQNALIKKKWTYSQYSQSKEKAIKARQDWKDCEQAVKVSAEIILARGYKIIWESAEAGIFTPYVLKIDDETGIHTVSIDGETETKFFLGD